MSSGRKVSKSKTRRIEYAADFETTTNANDCRVWLWGLASLDNPDDYEQGVHIHDFMDRVAETNTVVSFHNLSHDGTFIMDWLFKNGYHHVTDNKRMPFQSFTTLISNTGKFYSITIRWKNGTNCELRDSLKKVPMSLKRAAEAFKLAELKGELDYHLYREVGYLPTPEESDYMRRDTTILANIMAQVRAQGMTRLTVASDSMAEYKELFGKTRFQKMFPVLSEAMDAEIRQAYRGGYTYESERFKQRVMPSGMVFDVNSLYPAVMYNELLPYGQPEWFSGPPRPTKSHPLVIFSVEFTATLKPDHIPIIQIKKSSVFHDSEYIKEVKEPTIMHVTDIDWKLYNEHYDITVYSYGGGWRFKAMHGLFKEYIDKWSKIKAESTGGLREIAKLHLNSLYGKFASNPNVTGKIPYLDNGVVKYRMGPQETRPPVYTAMGVFITSYARSITIRAAQTNYHTFAYADTDSLHLLTLETPAELDVHPHRMGAWKLEYTFRHALYVRAKFYLEQLRDGSMVVKIAGMPEAESAKLKFADITDGHKLEGKLRPKNVPGGRVLLDESFTIKL